MKNYTRWLHWNITRFCNLSCEYCFSHSPYKTGEIVKIDSERVLENLDKFNEIFRISFTGGEPFLIKDFVQFCSKISEKHYLSFNTNLTHNSIKLFAKDINPERVIKIDASFHYTQLKEKKLLDRYLNNFSLLKRNDFSINSEQVAYPGLISEIDVIRQISEDNGLDLKFLPFFGVYNEKKYPESYTGEEINLFDLDLSILDKFNQKGEFCNAGYNVGVVFSNGNIKPCFQIKENIGNIYEEIEFKSEPVFQCKSKICGCPMNVYDQKLFNIAREKF